MNKLNDLEIIEQANYILENKTTIRNAAKHFNISKTALHDNLHKKLKYINTQLFNEFQKLMDYNFNIKHINGGNSTKNKWKEINK